MPHCLVALGSNLGSRREYLRQALTALDRLPQTQVTARSRWRETAPIGGPPGQTAFLNGAVRLETRLEPGQLHQHLQSIEAAADRQRRERWAARTLDVDLLLYDQLIYHSASLEIPHPRMSFRPFVLAGAAEAASWMVHPGSGWTVGRLWRQIAEGPDVVAIATDRQQPGCLLAEHLEQQVRAARDRCSPQTVDALPSLVVCRPDDRTGLAKARLALFLETPPERQPGRAACCGPQLVLADSDDQQALREAAAAMEAVWPRLLEDSCSPYD